MTLQMSCLRKCLYNDMASLLSEFSGASWGNLVQKIFWDIVYKSMTLLLNEFLGSSSGYLLPKKVLWHTLQGYGFSPEWVFWWFLNLPALENVLRHSLQGYVLSPELVLWCVLKLPASENVLGHSLQEYDWINFRLVKKYFSMFFWSLKIHFKFLIRKKEFQWISD